MHTASLTIKRVGEYPHLLQKDEKMTAYDNPLAEALASLDGCTITVEKKDDNALLLHIARSSRSRRKQGGSADLTIRLNPGNIKDCQFVAHGHRAYNMALLLIDELLAHTPPGRCNISLEAVEEHRRKRRSRR
ncbi:hypothetical protein GWK75_01315 [Candidatus Saccharibacteria bacterium oral taxon 955]|nr:hypothetical protein GWK75_01315 [Candidatus Saccharibacteria bacterium oral taxon 955]